jgi:outer membrane protein OmpA-like peptidoglycan-associated protein
VDLDGLKSNLPGFSILEYNWHFSDGAREKGASIKHIFKENGESEVKLGLTLRNDDTGIISQECVTKRILIFDNTQEIENYITRLSESITKTDIKNYDHVFIEIKYSADDEISQDALFHVEVMTSKTKLGINNTIFKNIPQKYALKEVYLPDENLFSYLVDREIDLMAILPAFNNMIEIGFKNARVRTTILKDPAEKEIYNLKKNFGMSADIYFDTNNRLTATGYLLLDQFIRILTKYPNTKLEIEVHTDNSGSPENNLSSSQRRAQLMVNYLINRGIDAKRLTGKGFGGVKPINFNYTEVDRKLNKRIDFTILQQ